MNNRVLTGAVVALGLLVAAVGVVYAFGTPQRIDSPSGTLEAIAVEGSGLPGSDPQDAVSATEEPAGSSMADAVGAVSADAEAPAPDPSSPLAIEIPGCRCHSDDPKLVKQHEAYRMNQCAGCHVGQVPTGQ